MAVMYGIVGDVSNSCFQEMEQSKYLPEIDVGVMELIQN